MIKIREMLKLEVFKSMKLVGDQVFYDNEVDSIGIFEYEAIENQYDLFRKGDFVITTLMFAKGQPKLAENSLIRLMKQRISAIAIKDIYFKEVSDEVLKYANKHKIQLLFFDDIPIEDIIVAVSDEIRNKEYIRYYENKVDQLINDQPKKSDVLSIIGEINGSFYKCSCCAFAVPIKSNEKDQKLLIDKIMHNVRLRKNKGTNSIHNNVFRYKNGIFIVHTFNQSTSKDGYMKDLIKNIGILDTEFNIGISDIHYELHQLSYGIKEALAAHKHDTSFDNIGIERLLTPIKNTYWAESYMNRIITPIKAYDQESSAKLLSTAICFIKHRGGLKATADDLGQHVNTIRHRLSKIEDIIQSKEHQNDFYEQLYIAIKLYNQHGR